MIDVIIGTQWGDEGKGKFVDWLAGQADIVARFQGGPNAGHTLAVQGEPLVLHQVPSGVLHPHAVSVLGNGMVLDMGELKSEIDQLRTRGIGAVGRILISPLAHLILPYHKLIDQLNAGTAQHQVGSTGRGIGPAYSDKYERTGIRLIDCADPQRFRDLFHEQLMQKKKQWPFVDFSSISEDAAIRECLEIFTIFKPLLIDVPSWLMGRLAQGARVLAEGAQATHLDIDFGTYPYVTSSHPTSGGVSVGLGVPPQFIQEVWGVAKAYTTRVGQGPFPTEIKGELGDQLREWGAEFGSTTGRPRRCGWFDVALIKRAALISGVRKLLITKLDVLGKFNEIKMSYGYEGSCMFGDFPQTVDEMSRMLPRYTTLPGWRSDIRHARTRADLPSQALNYLDKIEELAGIPIAAVSVGPRREETIEM